MAKYVVPFGMKVDIYPIYSEKMIVYFCCKTILPGHAQVPPRSNHPIFIPIGTPVDDPKIEQPANEIPITTAVHAFKLPREIFTHQDTNVLSKNVYERDSSGFSSEGRVVDVWIYYGNRWCKRTDHLQAIH